MALNRINFNPSRTVLRSFGLLACAVFAALSAKAWYFLGPDQAWGVAAPILLVLPGFLFWGWMRCVYIGACWITFPLGFIGSHILLLVSYFGVFTLTGLLMRLCRYDPLRRRREPGKSYWQEREAPRETSTYFKQH